MNEDSKPPEVDVDPKSVNPFGFSHHMVLIGKNLDRITRRSARLCSLARMLSRLSPSILQQHIQHATSRPDHLTKKIYQQRDASSAVARTYELYETGAPRKRVCVQVASDKMSITITIHEPTTKHRTETKGEHTAVQMQRNFESMQDCDFGGRMD